MKKYIFGLLLLLLTLPSCNLPASGSAPSPNIEQEAAPPTEAPPPPEPAAVPVEVNPFAGLIYSSAGGLWQVTNEGAVQQLAQCAGERLSADGRVMVYQENEDIHLLDLATCSAANLTNSPDTFDVNPQLWPARPDVVIFGINPEMSAGTPSAIQTDGSGFFVIDPDAFPNGDLGLSPDGSKIALPSYPGPAIYHWESRQKEDLDLAGFGLDPARVQRMDSPAWSPDGSKLAWVAGLMEGEDYSTWRIALLILDLNARTHQIIHPYVPVGRGGWPPAPSWSPDGQWLAANLWTEDPVQSGMYVFAADGSQEIFLPIPNPNVNWLAQAYPTLWRPDSQILLVSVWAEENSLWSVKVGDWNPTPLPLPDKGVPVDWQQP